MSFKIKINSLGPIKDSEIEFSPFMIFTGESNTGKSYSAFLVYYVIKMLTEGDYNLSNYFNEKYKKNFEELIEKNKTKIYFDTIDFEKWISKNASNFLGYLLKYDKINCDIKIFFEKKSFDFEINYFVGDSTSISAPLYLIKKYNINGIQFTQILNQVIFKEFLTDYSEIKKTFILPPARTAVMNMSFSEKSQVSNIGMYQEFLKDLDIINNASLQFSNVFQIPNQSIIGGPISFKDDQYFYNTYDNNEKITIPLSAASSAVKEISPLFYSFSKILPKYMSYLIEEPEAHLHPTIQMKIAKTLSYIVNNGGLLQITTHSDFLLSCINNLIKLDIIKNENEKIFMKLSKELNISFQDTLSPKNIHAYYFEKDSTNSVTIKKLDVSRGIPFDTFKSAVNDLITESNKIDEYFYK